MITNERQYRISKAEAERFEQALVASDKETAQLHPLLRQAMHDGLQSQLDELREQIVAYEHLRNDGVTILELDSLDQLPDALIQARIAAGLTHKDLAHRLGLREQQIQRYEATRYEGAAFRRIQEVANALGLRISERVELRLVHHQPPGSMTIDVSDPGPNR
jgi:ribosome-binding protein aMBF1 (putative translation factor)